MSSGNNGRMALDFTPDDGYTEKGYIQAEPGLHGVLRFEYRPFLVDDRSRFMSSLENLSQDKQDLHVAQQLANRLQSWSLTGAKGEPVPVGLSAIRRLKPSIFYKLYSIVLGTLPSDIDPEWSSETLLENVQAEVDAPPAAIGAQREAVAEKNSEPG